LIELGKNVLSKSMAIYPMAETLLISSSKKHSQDPSVFRRTTEVSGMDGAVIGIP
jgi:hypothetical protein